MNNEAIINKYINRLIKRENISEERFNELLELILSRAGRQVNEKHVFPLAADAQKTKKERAPEKKAFVQYQKTKTR